MPSGPSPLGSPGRRKRSRGRANCHAAAVFTDSSERSATIGPMRPISLRRRPPRDPRARLAGLMLLPRTIDKARAALRGGDLGDYRLTPGLSAALLGEAGFTADEFVELVQRASDEAEVANAVAPRIAPERCERWNEHCGPPGRDLAPDDQSSSCARTTRATTSSSSRCWSPTTAACFHPTAYTACAPPLTLARSVASMTVRSRTAASRTSSAEMMSGGTKRSVLRPAALMNSPWSSPRLTKSAAAYPCAPAARA